MKKLLLACALVLPTFFSSCSTSVPNSGDRNFIAEMIPHHHVGMDLLQSGARRSDDVRLRRLVFQMSSYHEQELDFLEELAGRWRIPAAQSFPGNISLSQLQKLERETGLKHDVEWLRLMIDHHEGALLIAQSQIQNGSFSKIVKIAETVYDVQREEIVKMKLLLSELSDVRLDLKSKQ
jgi:uncharacterized protein (DUF305 family)